MCVCVCVCVCVLLFLFFGWERHVVKHTSWEKVIDDHKEQIYQVNDFRVFPYMGRCRNLGSLKFFLICASQQSRGPYIQSTESFMLFSSPWIPLRAHFLWATLVDCDLTLCMRMMNDTFCSFCLELLFLVINLTMVWEALYDQFVPHC